MNDWNSIDDQLRSWVPRSPSPEVRRKIFGGSGGLEAESFWSSFHFGRWVVPALGCFFLAVAALQTRLPQTQPLHDSMTNLILPAASGTGVKIAYSAAKVHSGINNIPRQRVEWSFGSKPANSSVSATIFAFTNTLIQ